MASFIRHKGVLALALSSSTHRHPASAFQKNNNLFTRIRATLLRKHSSTIASKSGDLVSTHHDFDNDYELLKQSRPMRIRARLLDTANASNDRKNNNFKGTKDSSSVTKIIHFQRHGQGTHNELYKQWTDMTGVPLDLSETDPAKNPLLTDKVLDARLTQKGIDQCSEQRPIAAALDGIETIIVSPLTRTLETAHITFQDHLPTNENGINNYPQRNNVKWIAHEAIREELGTLLCNKRRPYRELEAQFPVVDYSHLLSHSEEDIMWNHHAERTSRSNGGIVVRESTVDMSHRAYDFLAGFVYKRPEREMAVVGHSAWLLAMTGAVLDVVEEEDEEGSMTSMFGQAELRSMELVFTRQ
mmetsp:Transcript_18910/g.32535  ORF Transcript_18910/g.32535 Transcript_18910/m.32535 type:complete len:357 (+) Transcript_18910:48-1118(+)